jgi:hypothetical protein
LLAVLVPRRASSKIAAALCTLTLINNPVAPFIFLWHHLGWVCMERVQIGTLLLLCHPVSADCGHSVPDPHTDGAHVLFYS